jgi:hypothetical protein
MSSNNTGLGNKPLVVIIGLIASLIAMFVFITGKESIPEFFGAPVPITVVVIITPIPVVQTEPYATEAVPTIEQIPPIEQTQLYVTKTVPAPDRASIQYHATEDRLGLLQDYCGIIGYTILLLLKIQIGVSGLPGQQLVRISHMIQFIAQQLMADNLGQMPESSYYRQITILCCL